uniref:Uncharacterized protein n=1 Tax=Rhodosorus marinus TaxID=101924 RepID=A0A7S0BID2_9RHOD|mmetsp:Transcript_17756/g.25601  ORF Transcript_17756/g.25601 Transcript_17756/m.25601 type:complete len:252 (+) Transcript_17756:432-1187(+)
MISMSEDRVIPTGNARSVVRSFLSKLDGEQDDESSSENENLSIRPFRLGVGAKPEHRNVPGTGRIDQKAYYELRQKSTRRVIEGRTAKKSLESTFDDHEDSRTASIGVKSDDPKVTVGKQTRKKKRKKKNKKSDEQDEDSKASETLVEHRPEVGNDATQPAVEEGVRNDHVENEREPEKSHGDGNVRGWAAPDHRPLKKKKKIRSRQKNLRKDTRHPDKRPAHLTEETLRGRRLPAHRPRSREEGGHDGEH